VTGKAVTAETPHGGQMAGLTNFTISRAQMTRPGATKIEIRITGILKFWATPLWLSARK